MFSLNCHGKLILIEYPLVMGILNVTTDSFYSESRIGSLDELLFAVEKMLIDKVDILDIGAQSSRPGSKPVPLENEIKKVTSAISGILKRFPEVVISADTYRSAVAKEAIESGASMINDVSGGNLDEHMLEVVGKLNVPYICMHMKGTPENMDQKADYTDIVQEVMDYFIEKIYACKKAGITDVIIDPGFGFAKNIIQNFTLLKNLALFKILDKPILAGLSRKSTIYKSLGITPEEALNGTTVLNTIALQNGATILRVHDVKEAKEAITLYNDYSRS